MKNLSIKLMLISFVNICVYSQTSVVNIDSIYFNVDNTKRIILVNKPVEELNRLYENTKYSIVSRDAVYTFETPIEHFDLGLAYNVSNNQDVLYELYFTQLPIINIHSDSTIVDEPKVVGCFSMCETNGKYIQNLIGLEYRGGWTQTMSPKKSFLIEFWKDSIGENTKDYSLLGMRKDDDWNLQAMYNQPLRIRSKLCFELWNEIDTLYYAKLEPEARNAIKSEYVELFLNNVYVGLYTLTERIDAKQLKLKSNEADDEDINDNEDAASELEGELYKGVSWGAANQFASLPTCTNTEYWGGFEYEYPDNKFDWSNLYNFVKFVVAKNSADFNANIASRFCVDNAINYYIFLNLIRATDNSAKNIFIAKYKKDEPYFYVPWDLDGTFGIIYNGSQQNIYNNILTNGLYNMFKKDTLEHGFQDKLRQRWHALRMQTITVDHIMSKFNSQYQFLEQNGIYAREQKAWPTYSVMDGENLDYTSAWLTNRIAYLDEVFKYNDIVDQFDAVETLNQQNFVVYPNPTSLYVCYDLGDIQCVGAKISIINIMGETLTSQRECTKFGKINISNLSDGVYFVVVDSKTKQRQVQKLIVKN